MNYSLITLGELLSSPDDIIKRNAVSILKRYQRLEDNKRGQDFLTSEYAKDIPEDRKAIYKKAWSDQTCTKCNCTKEENHICMYT